MPITLGQCDAVAAVGEKHFRGRQTAIEFRQHQAPSDPGVFWQQVPDSSTG